MRLAFSTAHPMASERSEPAGVSEELTALFRAEYDFVWRVLRRLGLNGAEADDGVQDVFLIVAHKLQHYDERGAMRAWLYTIARLVAAQTRRASSRQQRKQQLFESPATYPDPQQLAEGRELAQLVQRFMDGLDERQGTVFYLSEVEGLSAPEIAAALELELSTVLGRRRLSRKRFEAFLQRHSKRSDR